MTAPDGWLSCLRDSLVSKPEFRAWAARFPLTRLIARKRTRALFDLCAGFVYSQVLAACLELDLFEILAKGPVRLDELAGRLGLTEEAARRLLNAAAALLLVERRRGGRYGLGSLGAALVGNAGVRAMVAHHTALYTDLADPVGLLRHPDRPTQLSAYWAYARAERPEQASDGAVAAYSALMAASQSLVAGEILDAYDLGRHHCLLDVGGGDGAFLEHAARRSPGLGLILFDLPAVAARAEARLAAAGLGARARVVPGSFLAGKLPDGADVISLVRVAHDHDDDSVRTLLHAARAALPAHGRLILAEPMAETPGAERMGDAYFGFYLLAMRSGRPRSAARLTSMLQEAGFCRVQARRTHTPLLTSLLVATRG